MTESPASGWPSSSSRAAGHLRGVRVPRLHPLGAGARHRTRSAILLSALMFGFLHVLMSLFQQLFNATLLGIVLGLLAVRSRSILPGILFHFLNNALAVARLQRNPGSSPAAHRAWIYRNPSEGLYHDAWLGLSLLASALLIRLPLEGGSFRIEPRRGGSPT